MTSDEEGQDTQDGFLRDLELESFAEQVPCKKPVLKLAFSGIHSVANTLKKSRPEQETDISLKSIRLKSSFNELSPNETKATDNDVTQAKFTEWLTASPEQVDSHSFLPDFVEDNSFRIRDIRRLKTSGVDQGEGESWQFIGEPHRIPLSVSFCFFRLLFL